MGRATLTDSIFSVLTQDFTDWELLVVNASGQSLNSLPEHVAGAITQLIEPGEPLNRSSAANVLLDASRGKYVVFLDDDDKFLSGHLSKLVQCLDAHEELVAAYSDTQCLTQTGSSGQASTSVIERDFDPVALQLQNYLPIHSVLFRKARVLELPVSRFDHSLTLFEDWDFWLQLVEKGPFKRVPGATAVYFLSADSGSGHAQSNTERTAMLTLLSARQLERWRAHDVAALIEHDARITNALAHEKQVSVMNQLHVQQLNLQVIQAQSSVKELRTQAIEHEAAVAHLLQQATQREDDLSNLVVQAKQREAVVLELLAQAQQRESDIDQLVMQIQRGEAEVKDLLEQNKQKGVVLEHKDKQLRQMHDQVVQRDSEIGLMYNELGKLQAYLPQQRAEIETLENVRVELLRQIDTIHRSRSWRVTRPMRAVRHLVNRFTSNSSLKLARTLVRAVWAQVVKNGAIGFIRRIPSYWTHRHFYFAVLRSRPATGHINAFIAQPPGTRDLRIHPDLTAVHVAVDAKVSVVIPTLNAGCEFVWMLRKLNAQLGVREIEIVVVDSGSSDETVQVAREAGAKVVEILPSEFSHSYARNHGADHASGDYLLFMVQDAYPIGDYWLNGMLHYLLEHADQSLVAASCAEYSRSDSDMMYDSMIHTHYRFLGCLEFDRIGEYVGDDHMSLRSRGQLSDVSCLIRRDCFQQFRYRGDYAEDLDLGIRLIKSGKRVAMLAHIKVIHSHNRAAYYYLKRSFVDVIFLVGLFDDFTYPHCESLCGLLRGIESAAALGAGWLQQLEKDEYRGNLSEQIRLWIVQARRADRATLLDVSELLGDERLDAFVGGLTARLLGGDGMQASTQVSDEALRFHDTFLARLEHFNQFAAQVYGAQDGVLRTEVGDVLRKTFAAAAGSALAFYCLDHRSPQDPAYAVAQRIHTELAAGV